MRSVCLICLFNLAFIFSGSALQAERITKPPQNPIFQSIADDVYLQESPQKVPTKHPISALAVAKNTVYAVMQGKLYTLNNGHFERHPSKLAAVARLFKFENQLWLTTDKAVFQFSNGKPVQVFDTPMVDLCIHRNKIHGATTTDIYQFHEGKFQNIKPESGWLTTNTTMIMEDGSQVLADPIEIKPINRIASYNDTLYLLRPQGPALLEGAVFHKEHVEWGMMPSPKSRDMISHGSRLYITTDRGVAVLSGTALTKLSGNEGLPYEDTTCLARGFAGDLWIGTTTGAVRKVGDEFHFFGASHWLPGDHVNDIAVSNQTIYIATNSGLGIIRYEPYTLQKKAAYFEQELERWGHKRLGFVHKLYWAGKDLGWLREISDNDGGHTAHYLAAMCFKYAVTKDETTRKNAVDAFHAMRWLQTITGTDGFFARAIWAVDVDKGKRSERGSGGLPAKWYDSEDGLWQWKGDTSSDEVNAHYYSVSLFHDLVANNEEKKLAADHLGRIAKHIIDNGWVLRDMDGKPTRWGRWDPDYLLKPYGFESRGLNGMEVQSYLWTADALTGKQIYRDGLSQLMKLRYHTFTVREKVTFPPENVVPWDDELAFRALHPIITYCDDPDLRAIYLRALQRHWEVLRLQKIPFYNFIYGGLTGNDCESAEGVQHLREWSLDTVSHSYRNSHRADLDVEPGYTPYAGGTRAISPRELGCSWGSRSSIFYDGGGKSHSVYPPAGWLEDYWMGRYYGMIQAPTTQESSLLSVPAYQGPKQGAAAYDGPPRP